MDENNNINLNNGKDNDENKNFVSSDSNRETDSNNTVPTSSDDGSADYAVSQEPENIVPVVSSGKKGNDGNKKKALIIGVVAAVVVILCVVLIFVFKNRGKRAEEPSTQSESGEVTVIENVTDQNGEIMTDKNGEPVTKIAADTTKSILDEVVTNENGQRVSKQQLEKIQEATTKMRSNVGSSSSLVINEGTHGSNSAENTTANRSEASKAEKEIKAFMSGKYYLEGALYSDGEGQAMSMAVDGENYDITVNLDGIEVSITRIDGKFYLKRPGTKQYVELNDTIMSIMGITENDITLPTGSLDFNSSTPAAVYDVTVNDKKGVCYEYKLSSGYVKFFVTDGDMREIVITDDDENIQTQVETDTFSTSIPSDQLTLKGYEKSTLGDMMADVMAAN